MTPEDQEFFRAMFEIDMELLDLDLQEMQAIKLAPPRPTIATITAHMALLRRHEQLQADRAYLIYDHTQSAVLYELFRTSLASIDPLVNTQSEASTPSHV